MPLIDDLLTSLAGRDRPVREVCIGAFWTLVWVEGGAGLAATQRDETTPHGHSLVRWSGDLLDHTAGDLADLLRSPSPMEAALGMATVNALLAAYPQLDAERLGELNAGELIARRGAGRRVAVIGHFPFLPDVRRAAGYLDVLELKPGPGELPSDAASEVLPRADVVAITGTTLLNGTFDGLIGLCRPGALVLVLGPTTPLSPLLFERGASLIAGTQVIDPPLALHTAAQGAIFRQMRGVRLVAAAAAADRPAPASLDAETSAGATSRPVF